MRYVAVVALLGAGLIHLIPVAGVAGASALTQLYGIDATDPNFAILLQHRALLFGLLGVLMLSAVAVPSLRTIALTVGLFSTTSFIAVAIWVGSYNEAIARVVNVDLGISVLLVAGLIAQSRLRAVP